MINSWIFMSSFVFIAFSKVSTSMFLIIKCNQHRFDFKPIKEESYTSFLPFWFKNPREVHKNSFMIEIFLAKLLLQGLKTIYRYKTRLVILIICELRKWDKKVMKMRRFPEREMFKKIPTQTAEMSITQCCCGQSLYSDILRVSLKFCFICFCRSWSQE